MVLGIVHGMKQTINFGAPFIFLFFLLIIEVSGAAEPTLAPVFVENEYGKKATMELDGCQASLERPTQQPDYLHFRNDCQQPLKEKLGLLKSMIEMLIPTSEDRHTIRTLFVGRLVLTFPEFAQRLAKAASESPEWDAKRAWKEPGYSNRFVLQLLKQDHLFPELGKVLAAFDYQVHISSVEKILMAKPQDISFGSWLLEQGAHPQIKLPFDAMTWFHLEPRISNQQHDSNN